MNIKNKLLECKSVAKKYLPKCFTNKGIYIALALCVAVIGATTVFITTYNLSSVNLGTSKITNEEITVDTKKSNKSTANSSPSESLQNSSSISSNKSVKLNNNEKKTNSANESAKSTSAKPSVISEHPKQESNKYIGNCIMPVSGEIITDFSLSKLTFYQTINEWRVHSGVDISSKLGSPVKAITDGIITQIKSDPRYGITVVIEHSKSLKSLYSNLANDLDITPNKKVKQSDIIGRIGDTAGFESADPSHLHFEILAENQPVDPKLYFKK